MAKEKFEESLEKLENIVKKMEAGDLPLEDALKSFEEGIKLIRFCQGKLDEASRRVEILLGKEDSLRTKQWNGEDSDCK
jgi:exodeoxyribonuclease VII small subunit